MQWYPGKLLYGTDAYSDSAIPFLGGLPYLPKALHAWEEKAWLMDRTGRTALALALSGMQADAEIDANRAENMLRMVMVGTATRLYGL